MGVKVCLCVKKKKIDMHGFVEVGSTCLVKCDLVQGWVIKCAGEVYRRLSRGAQRFVVIYMFARVIIAVLVVG